MLYTPQTKKAMQLCFEAHKDQVDKAGLPYVFHPFHVAEQMEGEDATVAALLHDVVEDTDHTLEDLARMGFSQPVLDALALLTHGEEVPYLDYVAKLRGNPIARAVKLADLRHNSDLSRLDTVDDGARKRILKYQMATAILMDDPFDGTSGCYRKAIPLDLERLYFLTVFYRDGKAVRYSLDMEAASDGHYTFDAEAAEQLRSMLPPKPSLPEALAAFLSDHNDWQFVELLRNGHIPYQSYHFD